MIAFELKTEKKQNSVINKDDIGQGLNHLEWLKAQYADLELARSYIPNRRGGGIGES